MNVIFPKNMIFINKPINMDNKEKDIKTTKKKNLDDLLDEFLEEEKKECIGDECLINDGKEIIERVNKVYKTTDGRQLLM